MAQIHLARGSGNVHTFDIPLSDAIWRQYVSAGLYEVNADGSPLSTPSGNRPLFDMPEQDADAATWREWVVGTHALSAEQAEKLTGPELSRRFHMNPATPPQ